MGTWRAQRVPLFVDSVFPPPCFLFQLILSSPCFVIVGNFEHLSHAREKKNLVFVVRGTRNTCFKRGDCILLIRTGLPYSTHLPIITAAVLILFTSHNHVKL